VSGLVAQGEQDGGADRPPPHPSPAAPTAAPATPARAGAAHGVGEEVFVQVLVFRSMVVFVVHLSFLLVNRSGSGPVM
jgi:hypothetical protein